MPILRTSRRIATGNPRLDYWDTVDKLKRSMWSELADKLYWKVVDKVEPVVVQHSYIVEEGEEDIQIVLVMKYRLFQK